MRNCCLSVLFTDGRRHYIRNLRRAKYSVYSHRRHILSSAVSPSPLCQCWLWRQSFHGRTSLTLHTQKHGTSYFHSSIFLLVQTGAAGDAGRGKITYMLVMSLQLAQGTGTHTTVLASWSHLWQSYLHKSPFLALHVPQGCSRLPALMVSTLSLETQTNTSCRENFLSAQRNYRASIEALSSSERFCLPPL